MFSFFNNQFFKIPLFMLNVYFVSTELDSYTKRFLSFTSDYDLDNIML